MLTFGFSVGRIGNSLSKRGRNLLRILKGNQVQTPLPQKLTSAIKLQAEPAGLWEVEVIQHSDNLSFCDRVWKGYLEIACPDRLSYLIYINQRQPQLRLSPTIGQSRIDRDAWKLPRKLCCPKLRASNTVLLTTLSVPKLRMQPPL